MAFSALLFLAFALSMDAFAAAICKGAVLYKPRFKEALRTGIIFGCIEAATPIIGWGLGLLALQYIRQWDHWIAFTLLLILGLRMIREGFTSCPEEGCHQRVEKHSFWLLALTGIATSLDAMAVGVGLALLEVNIVHTAVMIGLSTLLMVTLGIMLGRVLGPFLGRKAEILGGLILMCIGTTILLEHLAEEAALSALG
ncbi:MAG: manganese efflux pump MntP [Enterobacteriaceae bacterium]